MAFTTRIKDAINRQLGRVNLQLDTLTAEHAELRRFAALRAQAYFDRPVFPVLHCIAESDPTPIYAAVDQHRQRFRDFTDPGRNDVGYCFDNEYYSSPDAEVLYAMVRAEAPRRVVEIGCGNSTKITRQAIIDGQIACQLTCIDPQPRSDVAALADALHQSPLEMLSRPAVLDSLEAGDLLFVDSSHAAAPGNDVLALFLEVVPRLPPGVLVHVHDIFLPFDYPYEWLAERNMRFQEQYVLQALLTESTRYEVVWPGHYLQRMRADFTAHFEHLGNRIAQSFWIRTAAA